MITDRHTKVLMTILAFALLLNGLNPWINPSQAVAVETTVSKDNNCSSDKKINTQTLDGVNNVERLLGYIESSVNDVQLTISSIDRKLSDLSSDNRKERN
ncbi:MAG: hypothetical protein H8E42_11895 [Nitrospinae bacterium]|nr:hypothetical protein [Nitrospinota bacterium]